VATLAELRARLRTLLKDNSAEGYLWSDATLDLYLNDALRSYGRVFPRQREATVATVAGQREYDLPSDCLSVVRVEVVDSTNRASLLEGGDAAGTGYETYGGKLMLMPAPAESGLTIATRYLAPHADLAADEDTSTAPAADEELLLAFACAEALQGLSLEEAKRQAFEGRSGQPAGTAAALYRQQWETGIRRHGSGVRVGRLVSR